MIAVQITEHQNRALHLKWFEMCIGFRGKFPSKCKWLRGCAWLYVGLCVCVVTIGKIVTNIIISLSFKLTECLPFHWNFKIIMIGKFAIPSEFNRLFRSRMTALDVFYKTKTFPGIFQTKHSASFWIRTAAKPFVRSPSQEQRESHLQKVSFNNDCGIQWLQSPTQLNFIHFWKPNILTCAVR